MAGNVIDSFVIELGLDPSKFTKGQKDAVDSLRKFQQQASDSSKQIESQQKRSEAFFSSLKSQALTLAGVLMGGRGFRDFMLNIVAADAATGRFAYTLGSSVPNFSRWQGAAEQAGGSVASISSTLGGLRNAMESFVGGRGGGESFLPLLGNFNVAFQDAAGNIRDSGEIILDVVEAMKREGLGIPAIASHLRSLPGMNEESINLFIQGRAAVYALRDAQSAYGTATDESVAKAIQFEAALARVTRSAQGLGRVLGNFTFPTISRFFDVTTDALSGRTTNAGMAGLSPAGASGGGLIGHLIQLWWSRSEEDQQQLLLRTRRQRTRARSMMRSIRGADGLGGIASTAEEATPEAAPGTPDLRRKAGAFSGRESAAIIALAQRIQASEPGLNRFTAGADEYHRGHRSRHNRGIALDFTVRNPGEAAAVADRIQRELGAHGVVINEYDPRRRSAHTTAPHIHVQFNDENAARRYAGGGLRPGAAQATPGGTTVDPSRPTTVTNTTNIDTITVATQATDAQGIAASLGETLRRASTLAPADYGQR